MKLQHLRFFAAVVDAGGVGKAAERLRVSQPAVSAGLKALEQELGQPLFERARRGRAVRPTSKALEFHRNARAILAQCDAARAQFRHPQPRQPKLRMGVLQTVAGEAVAAFVAALTGRDAGLRLQIWEGGPPRLADWLRQGRIDAAWTIVDGDTAHARALWQERFVVLAARGHRFGKNPRAKLSLSDLEGENIILRASCEMRRGRLWPESLRMRVVARAERDELALRLVAQGRGIAIAPQSLATEDVVARPIHDLEATRSLGLRWRPDLPEALVSAVLDAISSARRTGAH